MSRILSRLRATVGLAWFFVRELVGSSCRVAHDVLTPTSHMRPALVRVPYRVRGEARIALLANLVSLTPGTLVVDVLPQSRELVVHAMFAGGGPAELRRSIRLGFERRVIEAFGEGPR